MKASPIISFSCIIALSVVFLGCNPAESTRTKNQSAEAQAKAVIEQNLYLLSEQAIKDNFLNPPNEYRLVQYQLNSDTLQSYPKYGIGGFMAFFYRELYQQDPAAAETIAPLVDEAAEKDMPVWLADDFGYPSGMAGGRVVEENPGFEVRGLGRLTLSGEGTSPIIMELPAEAEKFVSAVLYPVVNGTVDLDGGQIVSAEEQKIETTGLEGAWQLSAFVRFIRNKNTQAQSTMPQFGHSGRYPDLLNPDAVASFLAHMHEPIVARVHDLASKVEGFYTNETQLMQLHWSVEEDASFAAVSWNENLPKRFREMHGYDLIPFLDALYSGDTLQAKRVRMHFHQTVGAMFTDSFARQVADWCVERGIASSGHFLLEEYLSMHVGAYGDLMKFASEFHVPAFDIGIPNPDRFDDFEYQQAKFFSSIAAWKEMDTVICLLDPIVGGGGLLRLSPAIPLLLNSTNRAFFNGANLFTSYLPLDPINTKDARGRERRATGYEEGEYEAFSEYVGRIALVLRGARRETAVALYYPIAMFQAEYQPSVRHWTDVASEHESRQGLWDATETALLDADIDYNVIHPDALLEGRVENGVLHIGTAAYRYVIMPRMELLPLSAVRKIREYEEGGGVVLWVDSVPGAGAYEGEDREVRDAFRGVSPVSVEEIPGRIGQPYSDAFDLTFEPGPDRLGVARFHRKDQRIYFLVNLAREPLDVSVEGENGARATVLNPTSGATEEVELPASLTIDTYRSLLILQ